MTDAADAATETADDAGPVATADRLRTLQSIDTEADQLSHHRERLPEGEQLAAATEALRRWEQKRTKMRDRLDELTDVIERAETESADLATHKQRLQAQLKTVIAPREAEALMHEITTLDEQTDTLDTTELEALEEQSDVDDRLTAHLGAEGELRTATSDADTRLERATSEIDVQLVTLDERRTESRATLSDGQLARYDRVRSASGVAVAKLVGHRCEGCHLDLSAAEVDDVKDEAAADGVAECPQCGRMLVV